MILLSTTIEFIKGHRVFSFAAFLFFVCLLTGCKEAPVQDREDLPTDFIIEDHRPQFHFSPKTGWMNDPNGMVYLDGNYHLFYQYYPDSTVWGPMHWGHTISKDLIHWEHLPVAIFPDSLGWIFSGSAVYDEFNTSGLGKDGQGPLIAIFTHHNAPLERTGSDLYQYQSIAYSTDKGITWQNYAGNPVLNNPGIRDFRDPKVFWHEESQNWIMVLAALNKVIFYGSKNLKEWEYLSDFGEDVGSHDGVWECPDLFTLEDEKGKKHWVLIVNMNPGNPNGGSGTQYFIGQFDGKIFSLHEGFAEKLATIPRKVPSGKTFENFESGIDRWKSEDEGFGIATYKNGGNRFVSSVVVNNASKGTLVSPEFTIETKAINFKIAGGDHRGRTLVGLEVDGKRVREAEGNRNTDLIWKGWDVTPYVGKKGRIKIIDIHEGDWGFIEVDEITFADEVAHEEISGSVWLDAGADNYAGVTWSNVPASDGRRIFIGWMSNWAYAQVVPTQNWRSAMTLPWELNLQSIDNLPYLTGMPVKETKMLRKDPQYPPLESGKKYAMPESGLVELEIAADALEDFVFRVGNELEEHLSFTYLADEQLFTFDRTHSGKSDFSPDFLKRHFSQRKINSETISLHIWIDRSSIEIFVDNGATIFTELFFPTSDYNFIEWSGSSLIKSEVHALDGIW